MSEIKSVLLLTVGKTPAVKEFVENIGKIKPKLQITLAAYHDLDYFISTEGNSIQLHHSNKDIAEFDMVYLKTTTNYVDIAAGIARYLDKRQVPFLCKASINFSSTSKFYQYIILCDNNIPIPRSLFILPKRLHESFDVFVKSLGLPFILKDINSSKGNLNYLIKDQKDFDTVAFETSRDNTRLIGQTFIPNESDYRILVLDQQIALVIRRIGTAKSHVNNISKGATPELVDDSELPNVVQENSLKAAKLLDWEIAGVDMVQDSSSGIWYCLEVNDGPQIATGSFKDEKVEVFASFIERYLSDKHKWYLSTL